MSSASLEIEGLVKAYGRVRALDGVGFSAPAGSFVCIVGPSGCGKSTLLRALAGLETVDAGRIVVGGRDVTDLPPGARRLGMVSQSYALFPTMSIEDNVAFGLSRSLSRSERRRRARTLLEDVGLGGLEARRPSELSGGQQQRVALARALAPDPALLLLDEPLSALDPQIRGRLRDELRRIQTTRGVTTVMVTHDQEEAMALGDLVAVLRAGRLEQFGPAEAVFHKPASDFVAAFFSGATALNARSEGGGAVRFEAEFVAPRIVSRPTPPAGADLRVMVRPESARLGPPFGAGLQARVLRRLFSGEKVRVQLELSSGETLCLDVPATDPWGQPGAPVTVHLIPDRLSVFERGANA